MFTNVLVGVDEEQLGRDAIALATQLVEDGGELTLAHIYHGDARVWHGAARSDGMVDRARRVLEEANQEAGGNAHLRWREAPSVGRGLHELAEAIHADLLVLGSCRHGAVGRVLVGDDTRAALNGAPCGVAVAPAGYADSPARLRRIGVGYDGSPESEHALAVARTLAAEHFAQLVGFEAISAPDSALS